MAYPGSFDKGRQTAMVEPAWRPQVSSDRDLRTGHRSVPPSKKHSKVWRSPNSVSGQIVGPEPKGPFDWLRPFVQDAIGEEETNARPDSRSQPRDYVPAPSTCHALSLARLSYVDALAHSNRTKPRCHLRLDIKNDNKLSSFLPTF
ncbi:hypothetical protein GW17_00030708 [Ensete ventricosum]|nr:hypothetical protein GW17_00030708 [Ensete ventricosum]